MHKPTIPFLVIFSREMKTDIQMKTCTQTFVKAPNKKKKKTNPQNVY